MPRSAKSRSPEPRSTELPSPLVVKLQITAAVFLPMALLGAWLRSQGFW